MPTTLPRDPAAAPPEPAGSIADHEAADDVAAEDETDEILADRDPRRSIPPLVDIVVPVYNEAHLLADRIGQLHDYLSDGFPFTWRITIADNASDDGTAEIAATLARGLPRVRLVHLDRKGRGRALRAAWSSSDAAVVAYMDVDLSTGLDALLPLVAPLLTGHSDLAIGSRLSAGSSVARGPRREAISRTYNLILHALFANRFHDAQCGFKAVRSDIARLLLPEVHDEAWFFDTELLLVAEHNGLRIHEVPVDWIDDPDSRVHVTSTAIEDLKGAARVAATFARGGASVDLGTLGREPLVDDMGRRTVQFAGIGVLSTACSLVLYLGLRTALGPVAAVVVALAATAAANSWAHRRFTFGRRGRAGLGRHIVASTAAAAGGIALSVAALVAVDAAGGGVVAELAALTVAWTLTTAARFRLLSSWVARSTPEDRRGRAATGPRVTGPPVTAPPITGPQVPVAPTTAAHRPHLDGAHDR
jgi:putative flippase GtrA